MALLENPSFQRARGWTFDLLEEIRQWVSVEEERLLDQVVYLLPDQKKTISNEVLKGVDRDSAIAQSRFRAFEGAPYSFRMGDSTPLLGSKIFFHRPIG